MSKLSAKIKILWLRKEKLEIYVCLLITRMKIHKRTMRFVYIGSLEVNWVLRIHKRGSKLSLFQKFGPKNEVLGILKKI